jgi:hypothetical protein
VIPHLALAETHVGSLLSCLWPGSGITEKKGKDEKKIIKKKEPQKVAEVTVALQMGPISYLLTCTKPHVKYLSYYMHPHHHITI